MVGLYYVPADAQTRRSARSLVRRLFLGLPGGEDQKEGMAAFIEKRPGKFAGR